MAFAIIPVGDVGLSTVEGVSDYWVRLPIGAPVIRSIFHGATPLVTDLKGCLMTSLKRNEYLVVEDCEDDWDELGAVAGVTNSLDNVDFKVGTQCLKMDITAAVAAGTILASEAFGAQDIETYTHLEFWIKSSVATAAGDLQVLLDDTAKCATPLETLNVPALTANVWRHCRVALATPQLDVALISIGLKYTVDIGACTIRIDNFVAVRLAQVVEALQVDDFIMDGEYFALSEGLEQDECRTNRVLYVYYLEPSEDDSCSS